MNIYIGKDNLPKDAKFLFDVEQFFPQVLIRDCEFNKEVIHAIDGGEYVSATVFKDKFGMGMYKDCLSTSCKILIILNQYPDIVVNCVEIGRNALDYAIKLSGANAFFDSRGFDFQSEPTGTVYVNGVECHDSDDVNDAIRQCEV